MYPDLGEYFLLPDTKNMASFRWTSSEELPQMNTICLKPPMKSVITKVCNRFIMGVYAGYNISEAKKTNETIIDYEVSSAIHFKLYLEIFNTFLLV